MLYDISLCRRQFVVIAAVAIVGCLFVQTHWTSAANKADRLREAEQLLTEALHREVVGDDVQRNTLLDDAAKAAPDFAPVKWHQGFVKHRNKWVRAEEIPSLLAKDRDLQNYLKHREDFPDTVAGQLQLSNWCREQELGDQERAHLNKVLELEVDNLEARRRLGFRRFAGGWMSLEDIRRSQTNIAEEQKSLITWRPEIEKYRNSLRQRSQLKREAAAEKIRGISDRTAIPALESILSNENEEAALIVVDTLANIVDPSASVSLVRHALFSGWEKVRDAATVKLRDRDLETYIPVLLAELRTQTTSEMQVASGSNGEILYRHAFSREGQNQQEQLVLDTEYQRIARPGGSRRESAGRAIEDLQTTAAVREMQLVQQNRRTELLNERIMSVLADATQQPLPANPKSWWHWWNEYNEVFISGDKPIRGVRQYEQVAIVDRSPDDLVPTVPGSQSGSTGPQRVSDCLAAGTTVWTFVGPQPIEQIQVGDLVLSQDPESGQLAYKPVLRTTIRPRGPLVQLRIGKETVETSGGHLFWVAGEGWMKSRELQSGMEIHSVHGTTPVSDHGDGQVAETFNLVVADFHTYFVGEQKMLSHDNTMRQPTTTIVPGLTEK